MHLAGLLKIMHSYKHPLLSQSFCLLLGAKKAPNKEQENKSLQKFSIVMRLEQLFVTISQVFLVPLPLLPPSFFMRVLQSSSVQNKLNKHFQDIRAMKGYADLVHSGVAFIGIITQERNEEFPHFYCFEKQAFCDPPRATAKLYRKFRKMNNAFSF